MSIFSRLSSRLRQDSSSYMLPPTWGTATERGAPSTFVPDLILQKVVNVDDLNHRYLVATKDPYGHYLTFGMANEALGDWFVFADKDGEEMSKNKRVQYEMRVLGFRDVMIQALAYERIYGWCYIYTGPNRNVPQTPEGGLLATLHAFTPEECVVKRYDALGEPVSMELTVNVGEGEYTTREKKITLPAEDFIFFNTRPIGRGYQGRSILEPVWDDLTFLRQTKTSMGFYDGKIGRGMMVAKTKSGLSDALVNKFNAQMEEMSPRRSMIFDGTKIEEIKWIGATAGSTDFTNHADILLQGVCAGSGQAKDVLVGASAGAISGSDVNQKMSWKEISEIRRDCEPVIREVRVRMGFKDEDDHFLWNARFAHDEEEKSKIEMNLAQSNAVKLAYMTIDEVRATNGLPPLPDERGDKLTSEVSQFNMSVDGLQSADEQDATKNEEGRQL